MLIVRLTILMTKESDYMLLKRNVIIHLLSLGVLCIGFLLFRYVLFDIHGMKQFPLGLFVIGVIS